MKSLYCILLISFSGNFPFLRGYQIININSLVFRNLSDVSVDLTYDPYQTLHWIILNLFWCFKLRAWNFSCMKDINLSVNISLFTSKIWELITCYVYPGAVDKCLCILVLHRFHHPTSLEQHLYFRGRSMTTCL